jgi:hypothetical protein
VALKFKLTTFEEECDFHSKFLDDKLSKVAFEFKAFATSRLKLSFPIFLRCSSIFLGKYIFLVVVPSAA